MLLIKARQSCVSVLKYEITVFRIRRQNVTNLAPRINKPETPLIINCKRQEFDHYFGQTYHKFDDIPLTSKGWNHSKSKGDYFIVYPNKEAYSDLPQIPITDLDVNPRLLLALNQENISKLTSFQEKSFKAMLKGKPTLLTAETGSGKTLAYTLPILQSLIGNTSKQMNTPRALILTPSRELAYQVSSVITPLAKAVDLNVCVTVGGHTKRLMLNPEFKDVDLLVSTPGVIGKLSTVGVFKLNSILYTVLDEADTLLDDSFIDRMSTIISRVSQSQLNLVSATMIKKFPPILEAHESNFVHVSSPLLHKPLSNITQRFLRLQRSGKPPHILQIAKTNKGPLIIFTNRSDTCNWLGIFFKDSGIKYARINGKMTPENRIEEWNKFVTGSVNILISTDVASRGLDTTQVKHVVNYDFPIYAADYLHRIGRTGRFGSSNCKVTNFISGSEEIKLVQQIELAIRKNEALINVDGNITSILHNKIVRRMRQTDML